MKQRSEIEQSIVMAAERVVGARLRQLKREGAIFRGSAPARHNSWVRFDEATQVFYGYVDALVDVVKASGRSASRGIDLSGAVTKKLDRQWRAAQSASRGKKAAR